MASFSSSGTHSLSSAFSGEYSRLCVCCGSFEAISSYSLCRNGGSGRARRTHLALAIFDPFRTQGWIQVWYIWQHQMSPEDGVLMTVNEPLCLDPMYDARILSGLSLKNMSSLKCLLLLLIFGLAP